MKNYIQDGETVTMTAPYTVTSGEGVIVGSIFGVAQTDAASGAAVSLVTEGVFDLTKLSTAVIAAGAKVSWDDSNHYANVPGTGLYPIGSALTAAGNGVTVVRVKLAESPTAAA